MEVIVTVAAGGECPGLVVGDLKEVCVNWSWVRKRVNKWVSCSSKFFKKNPVFSCCIQGTRNWSIFHNSVEKNAATLVLDLKCLYSREFYSLDWNTHLQVVPCSVYEIRVSQVVCMTNFTPYTSGINGNKWQAFHFMQCRCWGLTEFWSVGGKWYWCSLQWTGKIFFNSM